MELFVITLEIDDEHAAFVWANDYREAFSFYQAKIGDETIGEDTVLIRHIPKKLGVIPDKIGKLFVANLTGVAPDCARTPRFIEKE